MLASPTLSADPAVPGAPSGSAATRIRHDYAAAVLGALVYIGDRNGLFAAMAGAGPLTSQDLAVLVGQSPRYLQEWLSALACAGYVDYDPVGMTFELRSEYAACLADHDSPGSVAGLFEALPALYENAAGVADAFKRGNGVPQKDYGDEFWDGYERFLRTQLLTHLLHTWIPALDGIEDRLRAGASVVDICCGSGQALALMARAYPKSHFVGYDRYPAAIRAAQMRAEDEQITDRVNFEVHDVADGIPGDHDLICVFQSVHHMVDPIGNLAIIRQAALRVPRAPGVVLWIEPNVSGDLVENIGLPQWRGLTAYGTSTLYSLTSSLAEGGAGLGMCLGLEGAQRLAERAGFHHFRPIAVDDPVAVAYEAKP